MPHIDTKKRIELLYDREQNVERKLQLIYWTIENLKANENDEVLLTTFNLM